MAVVLLCGAPGSPGVTTTALGLALTWPRDVVLADCDRDPSQAVLAGYLRGVDHQGFGLGSLLHLHREGGDFAAELLRHTLALAEGDAPRRRFLPGFPHPGMPRLFEPVWTPLGEGFAALDTTGTDVLVDGGRLGPSGPPLGLMTNADAVLVVARSSLRSLAATRIHLATLVDQLASLPVSRPWGLILVGPHRPYASGEIARQFGADVWAELPWDPRRAEVLSDGSPEPRRFFEHNLMGRFRAEAKRFSERVGSERGRRLATLRRTGV